MELFGLKSCDTCRKALKALREAGHDVIFRDVRAEPLAATEIATFHAAFGDRLINRSSTTWRGLSEAERECPPQELLAAYPALMKRPVITVGKALYLGWGAEVRSELLK